MTVSKSVIAKLNGKLDVFGRNDCQLPPAALAEYPVVKSCPAYHCRTDLVLTLISFTTPLVGCQFLFSRGISFNRALRKKLYTMEIGALHRRHTLIFARP
ncbi:hypothetical protein BaRGS_00012739 [Batillaria attramentaria]|uniref:Uncharacterized protein n=1 Tax=Batillaria attramentaria TaxID=370345 RepID=A0ABD0L9W6_9CAEN